MLRAESQSKSASISKAIFHQFIKPVPVQSSIIIDIYKKHNVFNNQSPQIRFQGVVNNNLRTALKQKSSRILQKQIQKIHNPSLNPEKSRKQYIWNTKFPQTNLNLMLRYIQNFNPVALNPQYFKNEYASSMIERQSFQCHFLIGKGGYGRVWKVASKKNGKQYAMKQMIKQKILLKRAVKHVMNQRNILSKLDSPFIGNLHYAFQDRQFLYLVTDYANGGDLRFFLNQKHRFSESQTKFIITNLIIVLEYLQKQGIIHRDLKPENIMFCSNGYLKLIDFGTARKSRSYNRFDSSGTPTYMAPQILNNKQYSFEADYYALGVICFQLMTGYRPFHCNDRSKLRQHILIRQFQALPTQMPKGWDNHSIDFINKLLKRKPEQRLGHKGILEIKQHLWLANVDWQLIQRQQAIAPFIPPTIEQNYSKYSECISSNQTFENQNQNELKLMTRSRKVESIFQQYGFNRDLQNNKSQPNNFTCQTHQNQEQCSPSKVQLIKEM